MVPPVLAHPLTQAELLPVPPVAIAAAAVCAAALVGLVGPARRGEPPDPVGTRPVRRTLDGPLSWPDRAGRVAFLVLLAFLLAAGLWGSQTAVRNPAPVLLVGVGWPLLVGASAVAGPVWRRLDPFDGLARLLRAPAGDPGAQPAVWPAVVPALLITGYLVGYPAGLQPRRLATAVLVLLLLTTAGCLAVGRRWWLERVEVVGLLLTWIGLCRRRALVGWQPPDGAAAVLGVVGGVLLFGLLRPTEVWVPALIAIGAGRADAVGVLGGAALGAGVLLGARRLSGRRGTGGAVSAAAVPVVGGLALAQAFVAGRALVALFTLPHVLVDPFGLGWRVGPLGGGLTAPLPVGVTGIAVLQSAVLLASVLLAAWVVRRRSGGGAALAAPLLLAAAGILAATSA